MTNLIQYAYRSACKKKTGDHMERFGPTYLMLVATVLILTAPLKSLVVNLCMQSFKTNGYDDTIGSMLDWTSIPLLAENRLRYITVAGYVAMTASMMMTMDFVRKFGGMYGKMYKAL
mmetsp:Transcript_59128/g.129522  ORF Transcript_59128/g.129522 Transcript_59128/m.129522 type:complete len:117 (-) Transcript_59128:207-557(-)